MSSFGHTCKSFYEITSILANDTITVSQPTEDSNNTNEWDLSMNIPEFMKYKEIKHRIQCIKVVRNFGVPFYTKDKNSSKSLLIVVL